MPSCSMGTDPCSMQHPAWDTTHSPAATCHRELDGSLAEYRLHVSTGGRRGAATDADVHISLHGSGGSTPATVLASRPEHFERGQRDSFTVKLPHVGRLERVTVGEARGQDLHCTALHCLPACLPGRPSVRHAMRRAHQQARAAPGSAHVSPPDVQDGTVQCACWPITLS
jgi:hypothetical protein